MSTLEKAINLLQIMPEQQIETVYMYMRFVSSQTNDLTTFKEDTTQKREEAFQDLLSFAGTLPEDFDYKKELEEMREEKYARFI